MAVQLAPDIEAMIQHYLASGRYDSESDVVREAFEALDARDREHERYARLRQQIQTGLEAPGRIPYTPTLMEELARKANARFEQGERPNSDMIE